MAMKPAVPDPTVEALRDEIARVIPAAMTGLPRPTIYVEAADAVIALLAARAAAPDALRVRIEALADLSEAATPGPWKQVGGSVWEEGASRLDYPAADRCSVEDAALIVAAVNFVRALLEDGAQ